MIRGLSPVLLFLMFCLGLAELHPWPWGRANPADDRTLEVITGRLGERELRLDLNTCGVQRRLLRRLRRLVVRSIDQVKRCLNPNSSPYR
jgi:hypothetical protein